MSFRAVSSVAGGNNNRSNDHDDNNQHVLYARRKCTCTTWHYVLYEPAMWNYTPNSKCTASDGLVRIEEGKPDSTARVLNHKLCSSVHSCTSFLSLL